MSDQESYQNLDEIEEIKESFYQKPKANKPKNPPYVVSVGISEKKIDVKFVESQYYSLTITQGNKTIISNLQRRFSDFDFLFQILFREYRGVILPAFPEKGIVSYVKTKVSYTKDSYYLERRKNITQRFMSKLINQQLFHPDRCLEVRKFLSKEEKEFQMFKKEKKIGNSGFSSWLSVGKLLSYFKLSKDNRYNTLHSELTQLKKNYQILYEQSEELFKLLKEQLQLNDKLHGAGLPIKLEQFWKRASAYDEYQRQNLEAAEKLAFELFCQNEDILMAFKVMQSIEESQSDPNKSLNFRFCQKNFEEGCKKMNAEKSEFLINYHKDIKKLIQNVRKTNNSCFQSPK